MMNQSNEDKRKYDRYEMDVKIQFYVNFDITTKIDFRIKEKEDKSFSQEKHSALSRNVSVEGLAFRSKKKLTRGDALMLEVFVPMNSKPIVMEGEVKWSSPVEEEMVDRSLYETGVRILKVNSEPVEKTVFIDRDNRIAWSAVLESDFGGFKQSALKRQKDKILPEN